MLWLFSYFRKLWGPMYFTQAYNTIFGLDDTPTVPNYSDSATNTAMSSVQAAIANQMMNRPNEETPYGTRSWTQTGSTKVPGIGNLPGFDLPTYTSSIAYTPEGQKLFDADNSMKQSLATAGQNTAGQMASSLANPADFSSMPKMMNEGDVSANRDAVTDAMYRRSTAMLDPKYAQAEDKQRSDLADRGFSMGAQGATPGYQIAVDNLDRARRADYGDARDRAIEAGGQEQDRLLNQNMNQRRQAIQEMLTQRQLPMQEMAALMSGSAPQQPNFQPFSATAQSQGANYLGATSQQMAAELQRYMAETDRSRATESAINDQQKQAQQWSSMFMGGL